MQTPTSQTPVQSQFRIFINDRDVSRDVGPFLQRLTIRDVAGTHLDTAEILLDDKGARFPLPRPGAAMLRILLQGPRESGPGLVFSGAVDGVRSEGSRSGGRTLIISAKSADLFGPIKQRQERHFDDATIGEAFSAAAKSVGLSPHVDADLAALRREYLAMEGESFLAFGERLAREIGATFKVAGGRAMLLKRNAGLTAGGRPLPTVVAAYGENLLSWSLEPVKARPRHGRAAVRRYDRQKASWETQEIETGVEGASATMVALYPASDADDAQARADSLAGEISRAAGGGEVTIDADTSVKPEAACRVEGVRPGVDGEYRILSVEHTLDRSSGLTTRLELGQPQGAAGHDERKRPLRALSFDE